MWSIISQMNLVSIANFVLGLFIGFYLGIALMCLVHLGHRQQRTWFIALDLLLLLGLAIGGGSRSIDWLVSVFCGFGLGLTTMLMFQSAHKDNGWI